MRRFVSVAALIALLGVSATAKERWELRFKPIECNTVLAHGVDGPGLYLYLVYEVTNVSSSSVALGLNIEVQTDIPKLVYRNSVDPLVERVLLRHGLRDLANAAAVRKGVIEPGQKIRCLAVFGKVSAYVDKLDILVKGLVAPVSLKRGRRVVENRALVLHYSRPGDEFYPQYRGIKLRKVDWKVLSRQDKPYR